MLLHLYLNKSRMSNTLNNSPISFYLIKNLLWILLFEGLLRLRNTIRGTACEMPFERQQSFDDCRTSVDTFVIVHALLDRVDIWRDRQILRPHLFCVPHKEVQKLSVDIVSLRSHCEILNNKKSFSSVSQG